MSLHCLKANGVKGFPSDSDGEETAHNAGDLSLNPGLGRSPEEGHSNPLQCSCLENPHGQRSLVGYGPLGSQRVRHDWATERTHTMGWHHLKMLTTFWFGRKLRKWSRSLGFRLALASANSCPWAFTAKAWGCPCSRGGSRPHGLASSFS